MNSRFLALLLLLFALLSSYGEYAGLLIPTLSWPFSASRELFFLQCSCPEIPILAPEGTCYWFGWLCVLLTAGLGLKLLLRPQQKASPEWREKWQRFRSMSRGYYSLLILLALLLLAAFDQCLVGSRALAVQQNGAWQFPAFSRAIIPGAEFGLKGNAAIAETDYRQLQKQIGKIEGLQQVIMPPIPFDPSASSSEFPIEALAWKDNILMSLDGTKAYDGQACRIHENGQNHIRLRFRKGKADGQAQGWNKDGQLVYKAHYKEGKLIHHELLAKQKGKLRHEELLAEQKGKLRQREIHPEAGSISTLQEEGRQEIIPRPALRDFLAQSPEHAYYQLFYHPAPPLTAGHILGTNSQGVDIVAFLFGGWQVNIKAILFYVPIVYALGITVGMMMGYWGGGLDIVIQRLIEIISQLPFLFVVMILADFLPASMRGMLLILVLLSLFGWMHMTYPIRSATFKIRESDFVAAARIMGASPWHIMRRHILPNLLALIVTLIPFSIACVILALASLDYLGFGLPDSYASWGRLLNDGLSKLSSPWIVTASVSALLIVLLLINFIGEAIREAFDPRQHQYYE